ncbi:hypothetical protein HF313_27640 [Massilia atriviolacea]|uniref:Uncharacterized protein n=1 Tax=Massilia atriviolacea TaxID=2495579 RepID=A0A430HJJ3_9BURK|nr:hypothetical protein [Massilia atriviolacea]RSZ57671.1 hypothetical protein EJB06_18495 [Massilia atriviolacea]
MTHIPKNKPVDTGHSAAVQLFDELGDVFTKPASFSSPARLAKELEKPLSVLQGISQQEREALQATLGALWAELDKLSALTAPHDPQKAAVLTRPGTPHLPACAGQPGNPLGSDDAVAASEEDAQVRAVLTRARQREALPMSTDASVRDGTAALAAMRRVSGAALLDRIHNKELITSAELQERLGVRRQSVSDAVKSGRLFAMLGPSGENYYPAFYADPALDRRAVEKVAKALGSLPAASKYFFFTTVISTLQATPLQALAKGRLNEVLVAASTFAVC